MSRPHNLAKFSSGRGARSIWSAGVTNTTCSWKPWLLPPKSRTMFTTCCRSSVGPNKHQEREEKFAGTETSQVKSLRPGASSIYSIILALGVGLTAYGVYNIYESMTMWPTPIRGDLRDGIKYRNRGEFLLSIQYLKNAWEKTKSLPLDLFKPDPLLKTSGIAIVLAGVLESDGKEEEAYTVYKEALWQLQSAYLDLLPDAPHPEIGTETLKLLTAPERMRAIAIAYKLGCMAPELGKPAEEEEKWLTWAVNAILMAVMEAPAGSGEKVVRVKSTSGGEPNRAEKLHVMSQELRLPVWSGFHDLAAPFEALGTFYSKQGNIAYALPLYLQATSILIPPPPMTTSAEDRCRGAQLMGRISEIILKSDLPGGSAEAVAQATSWAQKGLDIVTATRQSHAKKKYDECELAYISMLFNVAMVRRLSGDYDKARDLYEASMNQSKAMGLESIAGYAQEELQVLESELHGKSEDKTA